MRTVTRAEWGALAPDELTLRSPAQLTEAYVHHAAPFAADHFHCAAAVRSIQNFHMHTRGWADIAYHRLVCPHGYVFEGRRLDAVGAHCQGHNTDSIGYALMWHEDDTRAPQDALDALVEAIRIDEGSLGRRLAIKGHRDGYPTDCPGSANYEWLQKVRGSIAPEPHPAPPAPTGRTAHRVRITGDVPLLREGVVGDPVKVWQSILAAHGVFVGRVDGVFGPATAAGTRQLQQAAHLATDAAVGPDTWLAGLTLNEGR